MKNEHTIQITEVDLEQALLEQKAISETKHEPLTDRHACHCLMAACLFRNFGEPIVHIGWNDAAIAEEKDFTTFVWNNTQTRNAIILFDTRRIARSALSRLRELLPIDVTVITALPRIVR